MKTLDTDYRKVSKFKFEKTSSLSEKWPRRKKDPTASEERDTQPLRNLKNAKYHHKKIPFYTLQISKKLKYTHSASVGHSHILLVIFDIFVKLKICKH